LNTYRAVQIEDGHWEVEWLVNGVVVSTVFGAFREKAEALFSAYELARMEFRERPASSDSQKNAP
jgi:hypothetical protein